MIGGGPAERTTQRPGVGGMSRGMELALAATALAWAACCRAIAGRAANGIAVRLGAGWLEALLGAVFLLFLLVLGLRMLDLVATRGALAGDVLPLPARAGRATEWGVGAALGWGLCLAGVLPVLLSGNLHGRVAWTRQSALGIAANLATLLALTLAAEVVFRGYALRRLSAAVGAGGAAVLMSAVFALSLVDAAPRGGVLPAFVNEWLLGMLLTLGWMRTRGLWLGWGVHFAYRAVTSAVLGLPVAGHLEFGSVADSFTGGPRWLSGGSFGLDGAVLTVAVLLAGVAVLYRVTREYAWHYTWQPGAPGGYAVGVAPPPAHAAMERAAAAAPPLVQITAVAPPPPIPERELFQG